MPGRSLRLPPLAGPIVIVDDDATIQRTYARLLRAAGADDVRTIEDERALLPLLAAERAALIMLDLALPHVDGETLLRAVVERHPEVPVIVVTGTVDIETAVRCIRHGAFDYVVKPLDGERLLTTITRALEVGDLRSELDRLRERVLAGRPQQPDRFRHIVTADPAMLAVFNYIEAVARSPQPVLIYGETGTGKELIARAIHACSGRQGPLVAVNAAGLDDALFSDTLFGHARGAYTTADQAREGLVAQARDGTLFLDEIGDLAAESQVKLLRLLQNRTYYPIGSDRERLSTAHVVVATNQDLEARVQAGGFRADLYYRLRTHIIRLPPLRARPADIAPLVEHFLTRACAALDKPVPRVPGAVLDQLRVQPFPGNVRELEALVYDAAAIVQGPVLDAVAFGLLPGAAGSAAALAPAHPPAGAPAAAEQALPTLREAEEQLIDEALRRCDGNQRAAAALLGLSRQALNKRLVRRRGSQPGT